MGEPEQWPSTESGQMLSALICESWERDVSPEAVYVEEKTCLHASISSAMQGYHRRLHRAVLRV